MVPDVVAVVEVLDVLALTAEARFCRAEVMAAGPPMGGGGGGGWLPLTPLTLLLALPVLLPVPLVELPALAAVVESVDPVVAVEPVLVPLLCAARAAIRACMKLAMAACAEVSVVALVESDVPVLELEALDVPEVLDVVPSVLVADVELLVVEPRLRPRLDSAWAMPCISGLPPPGGGPDGGAMPVPPWVWIWLLVLAWLIGENQLLLLETLLMDMAHSCGWMGARMSLRACGNFKKMKNFLQRNESTVSCKSV